jgi:outer membrane protein assembly factor BamB
VNLFRFASLAALVWLLAARPFAADQWPRFRGEAAGSVADDPALPDRWSETENVAWKTDIPGAGWSSPIVWDDHVIITTAISSGKEAAPIPGLYDPGDEQGSVRSSSRTRFVVYDVSFETGRVRWSTEVRTGAPLTARHIKNTFASETAASDGEHIYINFASVGVLTALDMKGQIAWIRELGAFDGSSAFGTASSPVLHNGRLYLVNDNATQSYIAAFEARTGREIWRTPRQETQSWATPFVWENDLRTEIVTSATNRVRSYGLDGRLLWELQGMTTLVTPSPFAAHGLLYVSSGYPGQAPRPVYAIRPGGSGNISLKEGETSSQHIAWYQPLLGTYNTSALVYGNYYYTLLDRGFLLCHDAQTGRQIYGRQRISAESSGFTASPWAYNGKVFVMSEDGDTFVVQAGPEFKILHKNSLNEMIMASPAIVRGSLIIRTQAELYRIARRAS